MTTTLPLRSASDQVLPLLSTAVNNGAALPRSGLAAKDIAGIKATAALPSINARRGMMRFGMLPPSAWPAGSRPVRKESAIQRAPAAGSSAAQHLGPRE